MKAEPMMPKAWLMPCICSTFTKASSVVIRIVETFPHIPTADTTMQSPSVSTMATQTAGKRIHRKVGSGSDQIVRGRAKRQEHRPGQLCPGRR